LDILLATVGAVLAFLTFVGGQYVLKLVIEPVQGMKKTIGEISHALIAHSKILSNSEEGFSDDQKRNVFDHLNMLSAQLQASNYLIPKCIRKNDCKCLPCLFDLPSQDNIFEASEQLQSLANCLFQVKNEDITRSHVHVTELKRNISLNLDIFIPRAKT